MKVVITSNYELGNETGSAKVAEELAKKLSVKNKVLLICLGKRFNYYKPSNNLEIVEITSIIINNIYVPVITPILMYQVFRKLDLFAPDVIHAQNSILVSSLVQIWSKLNKIPFVVTFHHVPSEPIKHLLPSFSKNTLLNLVQDIYKNTSLKQFLKNSSLAIAQNELIYRSIRSVDKTISIEKISNGVEIKDLNKIKPRTTDSSLNFVFLGTYAQRKNQLFLVKIFNNLPNNYVLNLYGNFKSGGDYLERIRKTVSKYKLKNVNLYDFEKDIVKVFKKNDYLISASKKEAQSLVVIQSLASGKPVIGLSNETVDELINKSNGLSFPKNTSAKSFAKELLRFIETTNYKKLSKHCIKDSKRFDIDLVVSNLEDCYQRLAKSSSYNR